LLKKHNENLVIWFYGLRLIMKFYCCRRFDNNNLTGPVPAIVVTTSLLAANINNLTKLAEL